MRAHWIPLRFPSCPPGTRSATESADHGGHHRKERTRRRFFPPPFGLASGIVIPDQPLRRGAAAPPSKPLTEGPRPNEHCRMGTLPAREIPEELRGHMAPYLDSFLRIASVIGLKDAPLVWLDEAISILARDVKGDVTKKAPKNVRQQCFITRPDGRIEYLQEWVTRPDPKEVAERERRGEVATLPIQSFVQFNLRLSAMRHLMHEKSALVPGPEGEHEESVIEVGPVLRCVAAYNREQVKRGRPAREERKLPSKVWALRELAAHLGLISRKMDLKDLKRRLQRARAHLK